jgi:hypothetical protein
VPLGVAEPDAGARGGVDGLQGFVGELLRGGRNAPADQQEKNDDDGVRTHLGSGVTDPETLAAGGQAPVKHGEWSPTIRRQRSSAETRFSAAT